MTKTVNELANSLYQNARAKGFYAHEDWLRREVAKARKKFEYPQEIEAALTEHFGNRLMLIAGEAVEAHEELRTGHGVAELYFSAPKGAYEGEAEHHDAIDELGNPLKPEGVLVELADVAIRTLETIAGILAQMTDEEASTLREQIPESQHTDAVSTGDPSDGPVAGPVNVAEILNLKAAYNEQRAAMHGRKF